MPSARILVAYYSRSGHTRTLARAIATALHADVEEIRDRTDRSGILGYLRSGLEAWGGVLAGIEPPRRDPARYDVVIVGTPVWNMSLSSPVRTYLWSVRARLPRVAFVVTLGGAGEARTLAQMQAAAHRAPIAAIAVRERALARGAPRAEVARFAEEVLARAHASRGRRVRRGRAASPAPALAASP